ncbi:Similar to NOF: 120.7 kDa protein in NOF-FB transposable element (Drosophila melanogaster) [Cotesia congregata]|uniref:Similar to NOF: 120.7 kDa protein in NOF-FB transposable element (Drosophila melanogaster) n=1 Tax=Cotesia congregata TaxID=51543 RepID=A0A8J2HC72_COTCN|nr:Similar to NOF: 120.7 kDa protein in NOF-FB transposable element (Drosophila melanogaster) [Cotesia congregata]
MTIRVLFIFKKDMPLKSQVSAEDAVNVLIRHISYFASEKLPEWSSDIWQVLAKEKEFQDKWNANCVRTNVRNDRRGILTKARQECGLFISNQNTNVDNGDDCDDDENSLSDEDDDKRDPDYFNHVYSDMKDKMETFELIFSRQLWDSINKHTPLIENKQTGAGFQPKAWTHTIAFELWKQYRLQCAFIFKKGSIHEHGHYYATMTGHCKSKLCKNFLFGYVENDPGDEGDVIIKINCCDTRFTKHENYRRPLRGQKRDEMKKEVKEKVLKELYTMLLKNFLSQTLLSIDQSPIYLHSMRVVSTKPFYVVYATPSQIHCYREYRRLHRNWSSVCIDATGGAAKKFDYNNNRTSAIFLYEIVINFSGTSVSVFQVLSEVHNADYITIWLKKWLREVKLPPHEVVSDGSRALLNAVSLAFNNRSLSDYNELCFNNIKGITTIQPNTYIRLDLLILFMQLVYGNAGNL